jgi:uncharacterized protein YecA (UPF0149 family)
MFFQHADSRFRKLASDWKSEQAREYQTRQQELLKEKSTSKRKIGRNDPCSCGSGMKYKKCCGQ